MQLNMVANKKEPPQYEAVFQFNSFGTSSNGLPVSDLYPDKDVSMYPMWFLWIRDLTAPQSPME